MLLLATSATTFYLPGLAPVTYCTTKVKTEFDTLLFYKNIICFIEVLNIFLLKCVHVYIQESTTCSNDIKLFVNRLNSEESVIPYEYHHFDFCKADESQAPHENLGQVGLSCTLALIEYNETQIKVVFGERIRPSPYEITFGQNIDKCKVLCAKKYKATEPEDQKKLALLISICLK